jgi:hypothetical protein
MKFDIRLFSWDKKTQTLTVDVDNLRLNGPVPFDITIENWTTKQFRDFRAVETVTDDMGQVSCWRYENASHGLKLVILNPRFQSHGETGQTQMVTYFDISVPVGETPTDEELKKHFCRYYGTTGLRPSFILEGRQHFVVGAYKD